MNKLEKKLIQKRLDWKKGIQIPDALNFRGDDYTNQFQVDIDIFIKDLNELKELGAKFLDFSIGEYEVRIDGYYEELESDEEFEKRKAKLEEAERRKQEEQSKREELEYQRLKRKFENK